MIERFILPDSKLKMNKRRRKRRRRRREEGKEKLENFYKLNFK